MKKILIRIVIVLLVLVVVAVLAIGFFLDGAVKKGVESFGPQLTKVEVKLDSVSLSILSGSGKIKGLLVGNPEGYSTPQAIKVGTASLSISPGSVFSDKIVIKSIRIESPEINYETGLTGGDNLHKILDNVTAAAGSSSADTNAATGKPAKKLQVDDFVITGAKVIVTVKGSGVSAPIVIPDIHLSGLGQGPEGITPAELTKKIISALSADVAKAAVSVVSDVGKKAVENIGKGATDALKGIKNPFKK